MLFSRRLERKELELGNEEYQEYLKQRITAYFAEHTFDDYTKFFYLCRVIVSHLEDNKPNQVQMRVEQVFLSLAAQDKELYAKVFERYLNLGDPLALFYIYRPLRALIDIQGAGHTRATLEKIDATVRSKWLFGFYIGLLPNEINAECLDQLLNLYSNATIEDVPRDLEYLKNYQEVDESIFLKVIRLTLDRAKEEPRYAFTLERLFNPYGSLYDNISEIFVDDVELLEKAYMAVMKIESHIDHNGKTLSYILDRDKNFITEFVSQLFPEGGFHSRYKEGNVDFSFIWRREDHVELMERITHFVHEWEQRHYVLMSSSLEAFFVRQSGAKDDELLVERQDTFLLKLIAENFADDGLIDMAFSVISEFAPLRRVQFIECFLAHNKDFDTFKCLSLQPNHWGSVGSMVPAIQARAEYLESLLPFLNTAELLEHKQYLEQSIRAIREEVEAEKRREFLDDRF